MDFAVFWLVIIGPILIGLAGCIWYGSVRTVGLWFGFAGIMLLVLAAALQIQQQIWKSTTLSAIHERPYITIASMGFPNIIIKPGPPVIYWDIENSWRRLVKIVDANMTLFVETDAVRLPQKPDYVPNPHRLAGIEIAPGKIFNATFRREIPFTESDVDNINKGVFRLYAFGFVRFIDDTGATGCKAFIDFYNPANDPRRGMFSPVEEDHKSYATCPEA